MVCGRRRRALTLRSDAGEAQPLRVPGACVCGAARAGVGRIAECDGQSLVSSFSQKRVTTAPFVTLRTAATRTRRRARPLEAWAYFA
jgi:hypothetical protein